MVKNELPKARKNKQAPRRKLKIDLIQMMKSKSDEYAIHDLLNKQSLNFVKAAVKQNIKLFKVENFSAKMNMKQDEFKPSFDFKEYLNVSR